jgi:hypothetical protein
LKGVRSKIRLEIEKRQKGVTGDGKAIERRFDWRLSWKWKEDYTRDLPRDVTEIGQEI